MDGRRSIVRFGLVLLTIASVGLAVAAGSEDALVFGLGGSSIGVLFPDFGAIDEFLAKEGFAPVPDRLFVAGGRGRGGVLYGPSIGGLGWGGEVSSRIENRTASLSGGFGALELGVVIGGDTRSLLTVGLALGGGGMDFTLLQGGVDVDNGCYTSPCGLVIDPVIRSAYQVFGAVEPFVSMAVQPLPWIGFEVHLGYLLPLAAFQWGDEGLRDAMCRTTLTGPVAMLSVSWGSIGRMPRIPEVVEAAEDLTVGFVGPCIDIESPLGEIVVTSDPILAIQTGSEAVARIEALKWAESDEVLEAVKVVAEPSRCGLRLFSVAADDALWGVNYEVTVPQGVTLRVKLAAGEVSVRDYVGSAEVDVEAGSVKVDAFRGEALSVRVGAGTARIVDLEAASAQVDIGVGGASVRLRESAAYEVDASVGTGRIAIDGFPGIGARFATGLGKHVAVTLGNGGNRLVLDAGVGAIDLRPLNN